MTPLVPITLFGWIPVVLLLFALMKPRTAVLVGFSIAWLFLPMAGFKIPQFIDYTKFTATPIGILLGILIFDGGRVFQYRPKLVDLPVFGWCLIPLVSSIDAGWGIYEGISVSVPRFITWGIPFLVGRLYFSDLESLKQLAIAIFLGAVAYVPFCLIEVRMSPQLHTWVYGYHQHVFAQAFREGGWRPTVFLQHGLAVANFMCLAAMIGWWLWARKSQSRLIGWPMLYLWLGVAATAFLCRSTGALALTAMAVSILLFTSRLRYSFPMWLLVLLPPAYVAARTVGGWNADELVEIAKLLFSAERVDSLDFRLDSEAQMWQEAQRHLLVGNGRFTFVARGPEGELGVTPDGYWIIALGCNGVFGVVLLLLALGMPLVHFLRKFPARTWTHPAVAPVFVLAVGWGIYGVDCLFNAMENQIMTMMSGGLAAASLPVVRRVAGASNTEKPWFNPPEQSPTYASTPPRTGERS